jgi:hypothetical protein
MRCSPPDSLSMITFKASCTLSHIHALFRIPISTRIYRDEYSCNRYHQRYYQQASLTWYLQPMLTAELIHILILITHSASSCFSIKIHRSQFSCSESKVERCLIKIELLIISSYAHMHSNRK